MRQPGMSARPNFDGFRTGASVRGTDQGADRHQGDEEQHDFEVIDDAVAGAGSVSAGPSAPFAASPPTPSRSAPPAAIADARRRRLHRAPGAERQAARARLGERHRRRQRADGEEPAAEADQRRAGAEEVADSSGAEKIDRVKADDPGERAAAPRGGSGRRRG